MPRCPSPSMASQVARVLTDKRQGLRELACLRRGRRRDRRPSQADPGVSTLDERQGRTLHQDPPRRMGLRQALPLQPRAPSRLFRAGSISTITTDFTPPWTDRCRPLSTASVGITARLGALVGSWHQSGLLGAETNCQSHTRLMPCAQALHRGTRARLRGRASGGMADAPALGAGAA